MTAPDQKPPPELEVVLLHAAEALALEQAATSAAKPLRVALTGITQLLARMWVREFGSLTAPANPLRLHDIVAAARGELSRVNVSLSEALTSYAERALELGIKQAAVEVEHTAGERLAAATVRQLRADTALDPDITRAIAGVDGSVRDALRGAEAALGRVKGESFGDVSEAMAHAHRGVASVESAAAWTTNSAVNQGSQAVADHFGAELLWVAERNACLVCLALSGHVSKSGVFDASLTFGENPAPAAWPPGSDLERPPRHPHCRCRTTVWLGPAPGYTGPDLPAALRREAERSILTGWRLPSESEGARVDAAARLLARGTRLPKSVQARSRAAVRRGHFNPFPRASRTSR